MWVPFPGRGQLNRVLLVLALLVAPFSFALDPSKRITQYVHDSWTTNDGLPQDSINAIAQTPDGYLWLATQEGLARFDGVTFRVYDSRNTTVFDSDFVHTIHVDRRGTLWVGAASGLLRYDGNDSFTRFGRSHGLDGSAAKYISENATGVLWIGFGSGGTVGGKGLLRFENGRGTRFTKTDGLPNDQVYGTATDRAGAVWIGTGQGLVVLRDGRVVTTYTEADGLPSSFVRAVVVDREGTVWAGTTAGLARFDGNRFTTFTSRDGLASEDIESIFEDRHGVLWIATASGANRIRNGRIEPANVEGVRDDRIHGFFEDREGNLWIGAHATGVHRLRAGKFTPIGLPEGLLGQSVHGIFEDDSGKIWMGTAPGGVNVLEGERVTHITRSDGLPANSAKAFAQERSGAMWIGTSSGLVRIVGNDLTVYDTSHGLPHASTGVMHEDSSGTLWVGTTGGLARRVGERFESVPLPASLIENIRVIREVAPGRLLVAGGDGVGFIENGRFVAPTSQRLGLPNFTAVHQDEDATLWLTSWGNGLHRLRNGKLYNFTSAHGLFDNTIWSIVDDGRGYFWMGSNRGIFRVSRRQLEDVANGTRAKVSSAVYGTTDGMRKRETNAGSPAALRASDGRLWFATTGGAVIIDPARFPVNRLAPNVVIDRFLADGSDVPLGSPVVLKAGTRSLEVDYAALSLVSPSGVRYRYRLDGFDDGWIDAGARRSAHYTNIDPGEYTFRVIGANEDGVWSRQGAELPFRIERHFHQTWWFYVLIAAAVAAFIFLIQMARNHQLDIRHRVYHDPMTGLPNRMLLSERAEVALRAAERRGRSIAILFLDLDGFKGVNDQYGHAAGDRLLQLVADRLRACIREHDTLARIGGDEFATLVADLEDESRAADVARRMIAAVTSGFHLDDVAIPLGVSIGIAFHPYDGRDIPSILQAADRAMYRAKLAGGNQYHYNAADPAELTLV